MHFHVHLLLLAFMCQLVMPYNLRVQLAFTFSQGNSWFLGRAFSRILVPALVRNTSFGTCTSTVLVLHWYKLVCGTGTCSVACAKYWFSTSTVQYITGIGWYGPAWQTRVPAVESRLCWLMFKMTWSLLTSEPSLKFLIVSKIVCILLHLLSHLWYTSSSSDAWYGLLLGDWQVSLTTSLGALAICMGLSRTVLVGLSCLSYCRVHLWWPYICIYIILEPLFFFFCNVQSLICIENFSWLARSLVDNLFLGANERGLQS